MSSANVPLATTDRGVDVVEVVDGVVLVVLVGAIVVGGSDVVAAESAVLPAVDEAEPQAVNVTTSAPSTRAEPQRGLMLRTMATERGGSLWWYFIGLLRLDVDSTAIVRKVRRPCNQRVTVTIAAGRRLPWGSRTEGGHACG
jgi:hypothetical protein